VPDVPGPEAVTEIDVRCQPGDGGWRCAVRVSDADGRFDFDVTSREPAALFPPGAAAPTQPDIERLVRETFAFLLEREHARSILPRFALTVVTRYFPEYPAKIRRRLDV
jgi:hypothetical protein